MKYCNKKLINKDFYVKYKFSKPKKDKIENFHL